MSSPPPPRGPVDGQPTRPVREIGRARARRLEPGFTRDWLPVLDRHPSALRPDCLAGYCWLRFPDRVREVRRSALEFWYDPPGCSLTDEELRLLRRLGAAEEPVILQAEATSVPAHHAFDSQVDSLRDLRRAGWIVLETWEAGWGQRGPAHRRYTAARAYLTSSGRDALELLGL